VLSGRGLCDELITRPEESYRLCCVVVCDLETSRMGAPYVYDISRLRVKYVCISKLDAAWIRAALLAVVFHGYVSLGLQPASSWAVVRSIEKPQPRLWGSFVTILPWYYPSTVLCWSYFGWRVSWPATTSHEAPKWFMWIVLVSHIPHKFHV